MPGVVDTTDTFADNQFITSTLMNNIIDQTLFTSTALANGTLALTAGQMKVATSGITSNELATDAVTANAIAADAVTTAKILNANVTTAKILDANVTTAKIADSAVTTAKITDANVTPAKLSQPLTRATAQNSTSGTSIDFTGIPSWVKRITVILNGVSTNGTSDLLLQLGAGSIATSGYNSSAFTPANNWQSSSIGLILTALNVAASSYYGTIVITNVTSNTWVSSNNLASVNSYNGVGGGSIALGGALDRIRLTTVGGTNAFDAGVINVIYE
jgi:hypothetical protein